MQIIGEKAIDRTLRDLPQDIRRSAINASARRAAKPIVKAAKDELKSSVERGDDYDAEGQSKLAYVARNIRASTYSKKYGEGAYVSVKGKNLQVGNRHWDVRAYAILLGEGSYKGKRTTRGTKANRGKFRGFGNFIQRGAKRVGNAPFMIFMNGIDKEIGKALTRAIKRG